MGASGYKIVGMVMILFGMIMWSFMGIYALGPIVLGLGTLMSPLLIEFVPELIRDISHAAEPSWDGEILYTDGSEYKIRYGFDERGCPWFVANDVCIAIGVRTPNKGVLKWGGVPLLARGDHVCFSEENVQTYLIPLAIHNHAANRLLVNIRNNVLRKLEKQRDEKKLYG